MVGNTNEKSLTSTIQDIITFIGLGGGALVIIPFSILLIIVYIKDPQNFNFLSLLKLHIIFGYLLINFAIVIYILKFINLSMIVRDFLDSIAQTATTALVVLTYFNFKYAKYFQTNPKKIQLISLIIVYLPAIIYCIILSTKNISLKGQDLHQFYLDNQTAVFILIRSIINLLFYFYSCICLKLQINKFYETTDISDHSYKVYTRKIHSFMWGTVVVFVEFLNFLVAAIIHFEIKGELSHNIIFLFNMTKVIKIEIIPFVIYILFCMTQTQMEKIKDMLCCRTSNNEKEDNHRISLNQLKIDSEELEDN